MIHLHKFNNVEELNAVYKGDGYNAPWVSWTNGEGVNYNRVLLQPLTFNILSNGNIGWKAYDSNSVRTIQYSKNGGEWTDITSTTEGMTISVVTGDVLRFKGDTWPGSSNSNYSQFTSTCNFEATGNPGSLKYGEVTYDDEPLADNCYCFLFKDCTGLISAPELPATSLADSCYQGMFYGCTSLTTAPELPATTLVEDCYYGMFQGCTSLTTAPELPATTLANYCYLQMFSGCTSLTSAPELPATTLANVCYQSMFYECTSLTSAPELPATTLTKDCYTQMFAKSGIISAPALPATELADGCYYMMFRECQSLTTAPVLPATVLADNSYYYMFYGCTSLTSAPPALPATTLNQNCYERMFSGCTSLTSAPELPATTLTNKCYYMMFYGCSNLNYVKCLATDISASGALSGWLAKVSSTGTFYKAAGITYPSGTSGIPSGWTVVEV